VLQSPSLIYLSLVLCLALISSLFNIWSSWIHAFFLSSLCWADIICVSASLSSLSIVDRREFLFLFISDSIFLLQPLSFFLRILILNCQTSNRSSTGHSESQLFFTILEKPSTLSHHFSNLKNRVFYLELLAKFDH
jgi:hypothetical protein